MQSISNSPYLIPSEAGSQAIWAASGGMSQRVELLRRTGKLSDATLRDYYGEKKFEQIAESNALEGSTLSVGETELAVVKGITISGHDPAFYRDALALSKAVDRLAELAREPIPTDLDQLRELHELILGDRPSAGQFRNHEVQIRGSDHAPPASWDQVMSQMEHWESWSKANANAPPLLRASVLHAWLEHIHPFTDGNGRTGRAITTLELVRAGYPPIIIRRKDRDQYLDALRNADDGNLGPFVELIAGRMEDALRDLERAAQRKQGYDVHREKSRTAQANRLNVWNAGVHLLAASIKSQLMDRFEGPGVAVELKEFDQLDVDDFIELCEGRPVRQSWAFLVRLRVPGMPNVERLAWASYSGNLLKERLAREPGRPAIKWSVPNPDGYPPWTGAGVISPGGEESTILRDRWLVQRDGAVTEESPSDLAFRIADTIAEAAIPGSTL